MSVSMWYPSRSVDWNRYSLPWFEALLRDSRSDRGISERFGYQEHQGRYVRKILFFV